MAKNKNNKAFWNLRIKKKGSSLFEKVGSSIDIDKRLYKEDILGSIAHVEMLFKQKIISFKIKNKIVYGLQKIEKQISKNNFEFDKKYEDIHMNIEKKLFQLIGDEAGYIHTARSRNDQVITDFKMWIKSATKEINLNIEKIIKSTLKLSEKNIETVMPGFTHLKNAQPISLAHYLMAYVEIFKRDKRRFINNLESLNESPLGVAAIAGTSFNIDRNYTSKKLGFKNPTNNSIDTISDRDFVLDFLYSTSVCSMHISRIAEELIIWNSDGFKLINLSDKIVTGSSIMPQKKNPDPAELIRGRVGLNYGNLSSMLTIMKGLPMSYFKDLQDDKKLVFDGFDTLNDSLILSLELVNSVKPNKKNMLKMANEGYTTATDFADYLVKEKNLSFRESYAIAAKLVNYAEKKNKLLIELSLQEIKKIYKNLKKKILKIFDVNNSVNSKKSYGGTSIANVKVMIRKYKKEIK